MEDSEPKLSERICPGHPNDNLQKQGMGEREDSAEQKTNEWTGTNPSLRAINSQGLLDKEERDEEEEQDMEIMIKKRT